jgi:hypothetical protein
MSHNRSRRGYRYIQLIVYIASHKDELVVFCNTSDMLKVALCVNSRQALSGVEKGQVLAYKKEGSLSREITRRIDRSPFIVNNILKLGNTYGTKKST